MLNVIMLNVANEPFMLNVIMLSVVLLIIVVPEGQTNTYCDRKIIVRILLITPWVLHSIPFYGHK